MSESSRLLDEITLHRIGLERYASGMTRDIVKVLDEAAEEIEGRLARSLMSVDERGHRMSMGQRERLKKLLAKIRDIIHEGNEIIRADMANDLKKLAVHEAEFAKKLYDDGLQLGANFTIPAPQLLGAIVTTDAFEGEVLKDWALKMEANQLDRIRRAINLGMVQGESVPQIVKRLKGLGRTGKGGVWDTNRRGAEALVRTAVNHVSNRSHYMVLERNPDLFTQYRWVSVLDERTCLAPNTKIKTTVGWRRIADIRPGDTVIGGSGKERLVKDTMTATVKRYAKVHLSNGTVIYCTVDHMFLTVSQKWVEAQSLAVGTKLATQQLIAGDATYENLQPLAEVL